MRAHFITLEGIEGSGKTTQMDFVAEYLMQNGIQVVRTREPGGTELSEKIRDLVLTDELDNMHQDTELLMMFAARVEHVHKVILPALAAGQWVLCDRFFDATYAYQGYGRNISLQRIDQLRTFCLHELAPDKTFLLNVSLQVSQARISVRGHKDRFEQEQQNFYQRVRQGYLQLAQDNPQRITVINAEQSIQQVQQAIVTELQILISNEHA